MKLSEITSDIVFHEARFLMPGNYGVNLIKKTCIQGYFLGLNVGDILVWGSSIHPSTGLPNMYLIEEVTYMEEHSLEGLVDAIDQEDALCATVTAVKKYMHKSLRGENGLLTFLASADFCNLEELEYTLTGEEILIH